MKQSKRIPVVTTETLLRAVNTAEKQIEETVAAVRKQVLKRFPVVFLLFVTLGVTATLAGLEQPLLRVAVLQANSEILLISGLALLVFTGKLYKKLG